MTQAVQNDTPSIDMADLLFDSLANGKPSISKGDILDALQQSGIQETDPRLLHTMGNLKKYGFGDPISAKEFSEITHDNSVLIEKALTKHLAIPRFQAFCDEITEIYKNCKPNKSGAVADYIPQLKNVDPEQFAISICTVDGQRFSIGETQTHYCVQSTCKPINYCMALEEHGAEKVHQYIGREPSGRGFNELTLNNDSLPHNPMINSGAIMSSSLIRRDLNSADRFDEVLKTWQELSGGVRPNFNNSVYLSEKETGDRNFALGYFMKEKEAFPAGTNLTETLEFYFQCCSIEVSSDSMATVAATLANGGLCPLTGKKIFSNTTAKNCLSLMYSCGMYDFSGEFAFSVGVPAKSGVSGALYLVIPHVMGISIWSPRLGSLGNSVRGVDFCKELIKRFNFHNYDSVLQCSKKKDPRLQKNNEKLDSVVALCWAASQGDVIEIKRLAANGVDLDEADYDGRTAMHLAASEGHEKVVQYLIRAGANITPKDRWGGTPLDDAKRGHHEKVIELIKQ